MIMDANHIRQVVAAFYTKRRWAVHFEVGLCKGGRLRADVLAMAMNGYMVVVEVKSSVADFRTDKKMDQYAKYANQCYVACSSEVYAKIKDKVLPHFGIIVAEGTRCYVAKKAQKRNVHHKTKLNLITRMAYRSADATLHQRKSKTAGRKYVASRVVQAIQELPSPKTAKQVTAAVEDVLKGFV
jgi:hypothetical protein